MPWSVRGQCYLPSPRGLPAPSAGLPPKPVVQLAFTVKNGWRYSNDVHRWPEGCQFRTEAARVFPEEFFRDLVRMEEPDVTKVHQVVAPGLPLRREYRTTSKVLRTLPAGTQLHVLEATSSADGSQHLRVVSTRTKKPLGWVTSRQGRLGNLRVEQLSDEDELGGVGAAGAGLFSSWSFPWQGSASSFLSGSTSKLLQRRPSSGGAAGSTDDAPQPLSTHGGRGIATRRAASSSSSQPRPAGSGASSAAGTSSAAAGSSGGGGASGKPPRGRAAGRKDDKGGGATLLPASVLEHAAAEQRAKAEAVEAGLLGTRRPLEAMLGEVLRTQARACGDKKAFLADLVREWDPNRDGT